MSYAQDSDRDSRPDADAPASRLSTEGWHEVSDAPTPSREGVDDPPAPPQRLAYRVDELSQMFGVCRKTIERAVADGRLKSSKRLGVRLIDARSIEALFDDTSEG
jgi:Helix-turn-helix domain